MKEITDFEFSVKKCLEIAEEYSAKVKIFHIYPAREFIEVHSPSKKWPYGRLIFSHTCSASYVENMVMDFEKRKENGM